MPYKDPEAQKEYWRRYRVKNRKRIKKQLAQWHQANREHVRQKRAQYSRLNKQRISDQERRRYQNEGERIRARVNAYRCANLKQVRKREADYRSNNRPRIAQYRETNRKRFRELNRRWRRANPEHARAYANVRRSLQLNAEGSHTAADIRAIWERQKHRCAVPNCKNPIQSSGKHCYHVDHITALSNGGSNTPHNLQILCCPHNLEKHARDEYEWAQSHGMLFPK